MTKPRYKECPRCRGLVRLVPYAYVSEWVCVQCGWVSYMEQPPVVVAPELKSQSSPPSLTGRQYTVNPDTIYALRDQGMQPAQIARQMGITPSTVYSHLRARGYK